MRGAISKGFSANARRNTASSKSGATARRSPPRSAAPSLSPRRLRADAALLHLCCKWVERAVQSGKCSARTIARVARKMDGRRVRGGKRLRLSVSTLRRHLWKWRKAGRSTAAFPFLYVVDHGNRVTPALRNEFLHLCLAPLVCSMQFAFDLLRARLGKKRTPAYCSLTRIFSREEAKAIHALHRQRLKASALERRCRRALVVNEN
jgi:hypothetical protein